MFQSLILIVTHFKEKKTQLGMLHLAFTTAGFN